MAQDVSGARGPADRPMSPHLSVWRWHVTMATSILHRAAIVALYVGALILAGVFVSLAAGEEAYAAYGDVLASPLGLLVLFGLTVAFVYLALYTIRQTFWDFGVGLDIRTSNTTGWMVIFGSVALAIAAWVLAFFAGAL